MRRMLAVLLMIPVLFTAGVMVQSVFAASFTIRDGGRVYSYTGFSRDTSAVLQGAGVALDDRDQLIRDEGTITVRRAPVVEVIWHGQSISVSTREETAQALLDLSLIHISEPTRPY